MSFGRGLAIPLARSNKDWNFDLAVAMIMAPQLLCEWMLGINASEELFGIARAVFVAS